MNHKITTEQLFALDKGETTVRELFPDLFQMKLGGYYGIKSCKYTFCVTSFNQYNEPIGFGFIRKIFAFNDNACCWENDKDAKPLTPEELQTFAKMLENEAVKRGYKEGVRIRCLGAKRIEKLSFKDISYYDFKTHKLWHRHACIFKNGIWAEILT